MVTLPSMPRLKSHHSALPYREVTEALETVEASEASLAAKLCLRFLVLTAARSGEARSATWNEIDEVMREWRIPAERMKGGVQHRVPLSKPALKVLEQARPLRDDSGAGLSVACETGPSHVGHDVDQGAADNRPSCAGNRTWLPFYVPRLGGRMHQCATRCYGVEPGPRGRILCGASLCSIGSDRQTPRTPGPVGRLPDELANRLAADCP